jgi:hypothetical protein
MRSFLRDSRFVFSGPHQWNALGLGSTAVSPVQFVYNRKRTGEFTFGGRRFLLRRVKFPREPMPEYFAVDLMLNHRMAGVSLVELERRLAAALRAGRLDSEKLRANALEYGTRAVQEIVERSISARSADA